MSDKQNQPKSINRNVVKIQGSQDNKQKSNAVQEAKQVLKTAQQGKSK